MSEPNIPIDQASVTFFLYVYQQHNVIKQLFRDKKLELVLDGNRTRQRAILADLLKRARQHGERAQMSDFERAAVGQFANYLVQQFHDLRGTPEDKRPHVNFVPGGGIQWNTEGVK